MEMVYQTYFQEEACWQGSYVYFLKIGRVNTHDCLRERNMTVEVCRPYPIIIDTDTALRFSFGCKTINSIHSLRAVFS